MKTLNGMIGRAMAWTAMLAMALSVGGCSDSDSDNDGPGDVTFPEKDAITVDAGQDRTLTFSADAEWKLTSNASWCRFVDGDFVQTTISGEAGDQSVTIRVSDDNQNSEKDDVAEITMAMGGKSQVIYEITRPRKGASSLIVKDESGKVIDAENPLLVKGGNITSPVQTTVTLEIDDASAQLGVLTDKTASWVTVTALTGTNDYAVSFKDDNADGKNPKYAIPAEENAVITFAAQKNGSTVAEVAIPIYYEGYAEGALILDPSYMSVTVSEDGRTMTGEGGVSGSESVDYGGELISTVTTRNDAFEIVEIAYTATYDQWGTPTEVNYDFSANGDLDWVTTSKIAGETDADVKNRVRLTVSELPEGEEPRNATVMIFPKAVYDEIKDDLQGNIIDSEGDQATHDIKSDYNTYIMANLTQGSESAEPEGSVSFAGYYYTSFDGEAMAMTFEEVAGMGAGLEPKMENISDTPEGDAIFSDYGLSVMPNKNVWKATVPAGMMGDASNRLGIAAVGMPEGAMLGEAFPVSGITGEAVSAPTTGGQTVSLWSVYIADGGKPSGYQVVIMNQNSGIIEAVCVVEVTD